MNALARRKVVLTVIATLAIDHERGPPAPFIFDLQDRSMRIDDAE
jgi:hypothetical protein